MRQRRTICAPLEVQITSQKYRHGAGHTQLTNPGDRHQVPPNLPCRRGLRTAARGGDGRPGQRASRMIPASGRRTGLTEMASNCARHPIPPVAPSLLDATCGTASPEAEPWRRQQPTGSGRVSNDCPFISGQHLHHYRFASVAQLDYLGVPSEPDQTAIQRLHEVRAQQLQNEDQWIP